MKQLHEFPDAHLRIFDRPAPPDDVQDVYLIGICGKGMGALAGLLHELGLRVRGSDEAAYPPMSTHLAARGIPVLEGYDPAHLTPVPDLVVVGNAATPTHVEATYAREHGLPQLSLPEAVAHFFLRDRRSLVVAGTHGKTTTTGMLLHVLAHAGHDPSFLVGGEMVGANTAYHVGRGPHFVIEGDEYDSAYFDKRPKFMHYRPASAIITSMEFDHADIYEDWDDYREAFRAFARTVPPGGVLALYGDDPEVRALAAYSAGATLRFYGIDDADDHVTARDCRRVEGGQRFTLVVDGEALTEIFLPMSGRHNLRNALGVCTVALHEGVAPEALAPAFASFRGLKRRQEVLGEAAGVVVVDDFAHHPTAVRETLRAVDERWPSRRVVAVFEPRSNSSRRKVFERPYAEAFDHAAAVFLSAPPLRHNDTAETLLRKEAVVEGIRARGVEAWAFDSAAALLPPLLAFLQAGDVVLVMSNGSFDGLHTKLLTALKERSAVSNQPSDER